MKNLFENAYDVRRGVIEGDHQRGLVRFQFGNLIERTNHQIGGSELRLTENDFSGKVKDIIGESGKLAAQLERCDELSIDMAISYTAAQGKLASKALPLLAAELTKRQAEADAVVTAIRGQMTGKQNLPLMAEVVEELLKSTSARDKAERAARISAFSTALAIVRDIATGKTIPRYLGLLRNQHIAATVTG